MGYLTRTVECTGDGTFEVGISESCYLKGLAIHYAASQPGTMVVTVRNRAPFNNVKTIYAKTGNTDVPVLTPTEAAVDNAGAARTWYTEPIVLGEIEIVVAGSGAVDARGNVCYVQVVLEV